MHKVDKKFVYIFKNHYKNYAEVSFAQKVISGYEIKKFNFKKLPIEGATPSKSYESNGNANDYNRLTTWLMFYLI